MRLNIALHLGDLDESRQLLPFGRLLCRGTACRTGDMKLPAAQLRLGGDPNRMVTLRHPAYMGSREFARQFIGLPITLEHPADDVSSANWSDHAVGITLEATATGTTIDTVMQIHDPKTIDDIVTGRREALSIGYAAGLLDRGQDIHEASEPLLNHLAAVQEGVCGERCRIFNAVASPDVDEWDEQMGIVRSVLGLS